MKRLRLIGGMVALTAAAALFATKLRSLHSAEAVAASAAYLTFYAQHGLTVRPVRSGDSIAADDVLALTYTSSQAAWLSVWRRVNDRLLPLFEERVSAGEHVPVRLPRLEHNIAFGTLYGVVCPYMGQLRHDGSELHVPPECAVEGLTLHVL